MTKETILWEAYKERLGKTEFSAMHFDLQSLLTEQGEIQWLEDKFHKREN